MVPTMAMLMATTPTGNEPTSVRSDIFLDNALFLASSLENVRVPAHVLGGCYTPSPA
jgi:hypothetical protein